MATDSDSPHEIVERFISSNPNAVVDSSIELLQLLADALVGIIGEVGFESMLSRSAHRVAHTHPWLQFDPRARPADPEFDLVRRCFAGQEPAEAGAAGIALFHTFIDILTSLIGEHITVLILRSALGRASAGTDTISKERHNG